MRPWTSSSWAARLRHGASSLVSKHDVVNDRMSFTQIGLNDLTPIKIESASKPGKVIEITSALSCFEDINEAK